ncbi:putative toxin-antitoxin system toxin component, PIN family [Thermodesulfatator indicus]
MGQKKLRVVLDTNVLISALLFRGELSKLILALKQQAFVLLFSEETLKEFIKVLHYPKFGLTKEEIEYLLQSEIMPHAEIINPILKFGENVCSDKEDQKFLELAVSAKADYLVSGDNDLLEIKEFQKIKIISPAEFLKFFSSLRKDL